MEEEELQLRPDVEVKAHGLGVGEHAAQHVARAAGKGRAVGGVHVADQARDAALVAPGQDAEAVGIGVEAHVALLDAGEALDGGAVELALVAQHLLQLARGDVDALHGAEDIGELQADKAHLVLLHHAQDVLRRILSHPLKFLLKARDCVEKRTEGILLETIHALSSPCWDFTTRPFPSSSNGR